ncbi:MAG: radical SAM protein [archaeon]
MKRVVLYNPDPKIGEGKIDISLALLSVAALPDKNGYDVKIVNHSEKDHMQKLMEHCKDALCIGITMMTGNQIKGALEAAKMAKEMNIKVVVGGWHPSIMPEQTLKNEHIDIAIRGQGQRAFYEVLEALSKNKPLKDIAGISYKVKGEIIHNPERTVEDLNNFPPLPYHLLEKERVTRNVVEIATRTVDYFTTQGCPHRCGFCADPIVYKRRWSALKPERVIEDLKKIVKEYNANGIVLTDTNFFVNEQRVKEICKMMIKEGIKVKVGSVNGRTETLLRYDDETWKLLKQSGFDSFLIGAESGLQEDLDTIKKDATVEDTIELTKRCKKYGFKIYFSFFIGLPPEPEKLPEYPRKVKREMKALVELIDKILKIEKEHVYYLLIYTPYPGSPLYEVSKKIGFKEPEKLEGWIDFEHDTSNTPWIPQQYTKFIDQLNILYMPLLTENVYKKLPSYGAVGTISKPAVRILHKIIQYRWNKRKFSIPIEYYMLKNVKKAVRVFHKGR